MEILIIGTVVLALSLAATAFAARAVDKKASRKIAAESAHRIETQRTICNTLNQITSQLKDLNDIVDDLKDGIVPDFEKAKKAAEAMDRLHDEMNAIMNYDPYAAIAKRRGDGE